MVLNIHVPTTRPGSRLSWTMTNHLLALTSGARVGRGGEIDEEV